MRDRNRDGQDGFALILAILSLMLLTFLGLALATSTSTELQIATNYRWSQQAFYNAEAGVEAAKLILRDNHDWSTLTWTARTTPWNTGTTGTVTPCATCTVSGYPAWTPPTTQRAGEPLRQLEAGVCDHLGNGAGYGVLLYEGTTIFQYASTIRGQTLNGAVTLWVRRDLVIGDGVANDDPAATPSTLVITSEGVAPYSGERLDSGGTASQSTLARANLATKTLEWKVGRTVGQNSLCGGRSGQAGGGQEGSGFATCTPVTGAGMDAALGRTAGTTGDVGGGAGGSEVVK